MTSIKKAKWVPKMGEKFWYVVVPGGAKFFQDTGDIDHGMHIRSGNYYKTRDEVASVVKKINDLFRKNR